MTGPSSEEAARSVNVRLVRSGAVVLGITAALVVIGCAIAQGASGALGALLGSLLVVAFFGIDIAVYLRPVAIGTPTVAVVVALYVVKLTTFGLLVLGLDAAVSFDHTSFAIAVVIEALVAAAVAVRAFSGMRVPYVQP